jgi:GNAT superfamily N-acetyltransferase
VIKIRAGQPGDRAYTLRSWLSSHNHAPIARALGNAYYRAWAPVVERQLARSTLRIACMADEPGAIVGFAVLQPAENLIHYVCVREKWRRKGVASLLLADWLQRTDQKYTHTPPPHIKVPFGWTYAPLTGAGLES